MSLVILLPTYGIIDQFQEFENLFAFYENGMKGIIRDAIILSAGYEVKSYPASKKHEVEERTNGLRDKVLKDYERYLESHRSYFEFQCYPDNSVLIECILDRIEDAVEHMMHGIFRYDIYDVSPGEHKWIGNDLAIGMEVHRGY